MQHDWEITGRTIEVDRLTALLAGGGTGALVIGDDGVGKSRVLAEVAERLQTSRLAPIMVTATPGSALLPLGSLAQLMPAKSTTTGLPILPVLRGTIADRANGRRPVIVVDDVHHLDDASAVLINQLVRTGDVGVLASQTSSTLAPEPVARLWQDGVVERVELAPLSREHVAELAEAIVGSPLDALSLELVWDMTRGNALFIREVLIAARESANLIVDGGAASIRSVPATAPRLVDFVRHRIGDLDDDAATALLIVAVGEPVGPGELPARVTPELLARLDASRMLSTTQDRRRVVVRLQPLVGEVLRAAASPLQLRQVHRDLVEALSARGARRSGDHLRLAHWSVAAQMPVAHAPLMHAARTARFSHDMDLARDLAETAWQVQADFDTGELLADIYYELGDTAAAAEQRPAWARTAATDDEKIRVELNTAITHFWKRGDEPAAAKALDRAEALGPSEWSEEASAIRALLLAAQGRCTESIEIAEPFIDRPPDRVLIQATMALTHAYRTTGRAQDAVAVCDRALAVYADLGEQIALITMRVLGVGRTIALADAGRLFRGGDRGDTAHADDSHRRRDRRDRARSAGARMGAVHQRPAPVRPTCHATLRSLLRPDRPPRHASVGAHRTRAHPRDERRRHGSIDMARTSRPTRVAPGGSLRRITRPGPGVDLYRQPGSRSRTSAAHGGGVVATVGRRRHG